MNTRIFDQVHGSTDFLGHSVLLSSQAQAQFGRVYARPRQNGLWRHHLRPILLSPDWNSYVPLLPNDRTPGYSHEHVESMLARGEPDVVLQELSPYFLMPLRIPRRSTEYDFYPDGSPKWEPPSSR